VVCVEGMARLVAILLLGGSLLGRWAASADEIPIGDDDDDVTVNCNADYETIAAGTRFGPGTEGYEDSSRLCWLIETGGTSATIVFDFFSTEYHHDYVRLFDASSSPKTWGQALSGELATPYVVKVTTSRLLVQFLADDKFRSSESSTLQLGFSATVFDSSDGSCANGCSGHGQCRQGLCDCEDEWGPDELSDCSIATTPLSAGHRHEVKLEIGAWAYFRVDIAAVSTVLVELVDWGSPDSDPRLMMALDTVPTLSHYQYNDWFNWYYDCSDIHYLRGTAAPGTFFVGVTNDAFRATEPLRANLTLRSEPNRAVPCLLDCNGHGTCDTTSGDCVCDDGWEGSVVNAPDTCQYEIRALPRGEIARSSVRIGDWDYYTVRVTEAEAFKRTLFISFASASPHSYPVVFARFGEVPRLWEGYLPTYEAFDFDAGDKDGFELIQGQRMSISVNETVLAAGDWYVGVYNIWGHNGAEQYNSHDTCDYEIWADLYAAGSPCPSTANGFCDGIAGACDFNTGICHCPSTRIWRDCSFVASELTKNGPSQTGLELDVDAAEYFVASIDEADVRLAYNLVIDVVVSSSDASPMVLARFADLPFPNDLSLYDDHDLLSNFYEDQTHTVLLDAEELADKGPGDWYIAVLNPETSAAPLQYSIAATWAPTVDCPTDHATGSLSCSGDGVCVSTLGRCDCDDGHVMDDCSADGVFRLSHDTPLAAVGSDLAPPIAPDDWVYWSVVVGCADRALTVTFETSNDAAVPLLVVRRGKLPLMATGTFDYWDYYTGENGNQPTQRLKITSCDDAVNGCGSNGCCVAPLYPGTTFATGSPEPGVYYIGVYNDKAAAEAIDDYFVSVDLANAPGRPAKCATCANGFKGADCDVPCPGLAPSDVYSNSPTGADKVCSDHGDCLGDADPVCSCEDGFVGDLCQSPCPAGDDGLVCGGRGTCGYEEAGAVCDCQDGFGGIECLESCTEEGCGEHGSCSFSEPDANTGAVSARCVCDDGFVGDTCSFECPAHHCSGKGTCVVVHSYAGDPLRASCECDPGQHGDDCSLRCPTTVPDADCSGNGMCQLADDGASVSCACFDTHTGAACNSSSSSSSKKKSSSSSGLSRATTASLAAAAVALLVLAVAAAFLAERRKREISRYERLVREVGAASSTIITAAGVNYEAPNVDQVGEAPIPKFDEMRDVSDAVSPFHHERVDL